MPRQRRVQVDVEPSGRLTSIERVRAQLFDVDVDRKKRIDDTIDYFGAGPIDTPPDPCGDSLLEEFGTPPSQT